MPDAEPGQIVADHRHHRFDGDSLDRRQPARLRPVAQARPVALDQRRAGRLQIVAWIEPGRDLADCFAERLAIAQMSRAGEHVDLGAGIVDVVFAADVEAGLDQQIGQHVAEHGAAGVADMHRPGRVGRDIFDIDPGALPCRRIAVTRAGREHVAQPRMPEPCQNPSARRQFRKPGPAIETSVTASWLLSASASSSATARGAIPAGFDSTSAALVETSPCAGSRGGSTVTRLKSSPDGSLPAVSSRARLAAISARKYVNRFIRPNHSLDAATGRASDHV